MKKLFLLVALAAFACSDSRAQTIAVVSKGDIGIQFGPNIPSGAKTFGPSVPALIANMKSGVTYELSYTRKIAGPLYTGATAGQTSFSGWAGPDGDHTFQDSRTNIRSLQVVIMLKFFHPNGRRKLEGVLSVMPGLHAVKTETSVNSTINSETNIDPLTVSATRPGIGFLAGANYVISPVLGISARAGYQSVTARSKVFSESAFTWTQLRIGIYYRLNRDHRRYSNL